MNPSIGVRVPVSQPFWDRWEIPMYKMREWSMRHARVLNHIYNLLERFLVLINPILLRIKYKRIEIKCNSRNAISRTVS